MPNDSDLNPVNAPPPLLTQLAYATAALPSSLGDASMRGLLQVYSVAVTPAGHAYLAAAGHAEGSGYSAMCAAEVLLGEAIRHSPAQVHPLLAQARDLVAAARAMRDGSLLPETVRGRMH